MFKNKKAIAKKSKHLKSNAKQYIFELKKLRKEISFDPIFSDFSLLVRPEEERSIESLYPVYLKDNHPFTPSFMYPVLGSYDFSKLPPPSLDALTEKQKQEDAVITKAEPEPGMFSRACGVCRRQYDQYFSHVQSEVHKNWLRESTYQTEIKNYCLAWKKTHTANP